MKGDPKAFNELIQIVRSDSSMYARQNAANSLNRLHDARAIKPLAEAMIHDEYAGVRCVAAIALGNFGFHQELTIALKDPDSYTRREVACILGKLGDNRAVEPLVESLRDPDIGVQCAASIALGEIEDLRATDALLAMQNNENKSTRNAAAIALRKLKNQSPKEAI